MGKRNRTTGKHLWRRSTYNEIEKVVAKCRFLRHLPVNENQEYRQEGTGKGLTQKARRECNPQRHQIAEFAAVVASRQLLGLFEVLRGTKNGVYGSVDAHAVSVDH